MSEEQNVKTVECACLVNGCQETLQVTKAYMGYCSIIAKNDKHQIGPMQIYVEALKKALEWSTEDA